MWLPLVGVPSLIKEGLEPYREFFCRDAGFEHVSRYITGLLLSPNKTLQGIDAQQVWAKAGGVSRRAMHAAVFEAGGDSEGLLARHRAVVAGEHRGRGLEVMVLDWTYVHHDRGPEIYATKRAYDPVEGRMSTYPTLVTAVVAHADRVDGLALEVQFPNSQAEELGYLNMTAQEDYTALEQARERFIDLLHYQKNRLSYRKRTEIAVEMVRQLEAEGHFPQAPYAFDNGVLSLPLIQLIEQQGKHWVSELESSRLIQWQGQWRRVDEIAAELRQQHPESFRRVNVKRRSGEEKAFWAFTKTVRLKRYGRKRLVIVHEQADLSDTPRFLLTDALHWEAGRVIRVWSDRWPVEIFHEFCKQAVGLEASQVRKEEALKRHFRLSGVAQSLLQRTPAGGRKSERFAFAEDNQQTVAQKLYTLTRDALSQWVQLAQGLFAQGQSYQQVLERLMSV
ncbi:hypothetical protein [Nitrosococcus wardiae]|nr:hypothetical protein [Nitrosococcus wardiae]